MNAVVEHKVTELASEGVLTPMDMLDRAVASGASVEVLERLMSLQERWETNQARKAFDNAMAAAKEDIPVIIKNQAVDFTTQKGRTNYQYEDLADIATVVNPILSKHGLSYRYRSTSNANEPVTVTCIVSHRDGHSEETTLAGPKDDSGNKNSVQAIGSTITYLQRYTLKSALGLAASNDDDGANSETSGPITKDQVKAIRSLIEKTNSDIAKFCKYMGVEAIPDIPSDRYNDAISALEAAGKRK